MIVDCAQYRDGVRQDVGQLEVEIAAERARRGDGFVWLGLHEPDEAELDRVGRAFGLHELALEDAYNKHQRPKLEDYDGSYFVVLKTAHYDDAREEVEFGEINLFLGSGYVIAVRHGRGSALGPARERLEARPDLVAAGPAAAAWAILDKVVDDYEPVAAGIDNDIAEVEREVFADRDVDATQRIYFLRREVIEFHRAVQPLVGPLESLEGGMVVDLDEQIRRYFRDVADHTRRIDEQLHDQRDLLTGALDANLALITLRQNEVVRAISAWAAIIALPTFIASVYGMNFTHMPELDSELGYPLALFVMALVVFAMHRFFKRINWL
ncbi:MAG TPA: magnesium/cobalt transporter CorA [Solirubrobacterales bacterium]|nr:magnesium/cobalt transporter CorA [Solirubrobacterales bacterium]